MKKLQPVERIYMTKEELQIMERDILNRRHIERYAMIRQWCYGKVLDFACGCGYGSDLISKNPDVSGVVGVDIDESAIDWAKENFSNEKIRFERMDISDFNEKVDVLVTLETIEHIKEKGTIPAIAERLQIPRLFVSFPSKKTTHYNKYHYYDFNTQEICDLFPSYQLVEEIELHKEVKILNFIRK